MSEEARTVCTRMVAMMAALACIGAGSATRSWAGGCSNEQIRLEEPYGSNLPDCRAYEQVSPTNKNLADARGVVDLVQVSPQGEQATFYSIIPFPATEGSASFPQYLSTRSDTGGLEVWKTTGLEPRSPVDSGSQVFGSTEDLSRTVVLSSDQPALAPGGREGSNYYIRDNATGEYRLFVRGGLGGLALVERYAKWIPSSVRNARGSIAQSRRRSSQSLRMERRKHQPGGCRLGGGSLQL